MKKISLLTALLISFYLTHAQIRRNPVSTAQTDTVLTKANEDDAAVSRRQMIRELGLTREQMEKLKVIREESKAQLEALENNTRLTEEERKRQLRAIQADILQKNSRVLSAEQMEKMKAFRQSKKMKKQPPEKT